MSKVAKNEPEPAYYYLGLAAHPGKMFRIRCEEMPNPVEIASHFIPTSERFNAGWRDQTAMGQNTSSNCWPFQVEKPITVPVPRAPLTRWQRFVAYLKSLN